MGRDRHRGRLTLYVTLGALLVALAIAWNVYSIRAATKWFLWSHRYEAEVLAQPELENGELKHVAWDGWGWAGQDTTVYLVSDPTDALAAAAKAKQPGKFSGIPCEVPAVRRMEPNWYTVQFYTNEFWGRHNALNCTASADPQPPTFQAGKASSPSLAAPAVPERVARYARDMELLAHRAAPVSLQDIFEEGVSVADVLVNHDLERFDNATYEKVRTMMVGFLVNREEVIVAAPDADFFLKLAREKGTDADRAFFEALKKTYPDGYWPAYSMRQTDYSGCTMFEGKELPDVYGAWVVFQKAYPGHYRAAAAKELAEVEDALGSSTCACSEEDGVRKGLEDFLNAYPASPVAAKVAARLEALKNHTSNIRFNCHSG